MPRQNTPMTSRHRVHCSGTRKRRCYGGANAQPSKRALTTAQIKARVAKDINAKIKKDCATLYSMHIPPRNEKDKQIFCNMLRNYAVLVSPDAHKAAEELRKIASAHVKQHWTKKALAKETNPLKAICEAMWNDTTPEGSEVFHKIQKKGFWNFVSRLPMTIASAAAGVDMAKYVFTSDNPSKKPSNIQLLLTYIVGVIGGYGGWKYVNKDSFKSDSDIAKLIRAGITRKNQNNK